MSDRRRKLIGAMTLTLAVCAEAANPVAATAAAPAAVSFTANVKPIMARGCFSCHGPTEENGGLRLHKQDAAFAELESGGRAIVAGKPDESLLIARVAAHDEAERMPPEGKPLTAEEIATLRTWIEQGAKWESH